jgi:hypothetical protein
MANLTLPRKTIKLDVDSVLPQLLQVGVAAGVVIQSGALVTSDAIGWARPGGVGVALGRALQTVDNTNGVAGALTILVEPGCFNWQSAGGADAISLATVARGATVYIFDDHTVAATSAFGTRSPAGYFVGINELDGTIWVQTGLAGLAAASTSTPSAPGLTQAIWYVDPQNTSGTASNANDGLTTATALLTYAEIVRRWGGTTSPTITQSTRLIWLSSHTDDSDPVVWTPVMTKASTASIESVPTVLATGVILASVVARNTAAGSNALLQADIGASGSLNVLVKNTTAGKSSICGVYSLVAGTTFRLYQPLAPTSVGGTTFPAEVNTWANGDTVDILLPQAIDLVTFDPIVATSNSTLTNYGHIYQITSFNPLDATFAPFHRTHIGQFVRVMESVMRRALWLEGKASPSTSPFTTGGLINVACQRGVDGAMGAFTTFYGGGNNANSASNLGAAFFTSFTSNCTFSVHVDGSGASGSVWLDKPLFIDSNFNINAGTVIFGPSEIRVQGTSRVSIDPGATFVGTFTGPSYIASGVKMNGAYTASSVISGAPSVINGGIATTVANLDAAAGAAGFGGLAFNLGGASLAKAA